MVIKAEASATPAVWKDTTSYSRDDDKTKPRTWTFGTGPFSVTVTKGHIYAPDRWVMHFRAANVQTHPLGPASWPAEQAQAKALEIAHRLMKKAAVMLRMPS